uniref:zinc fingers and homeoboxes protein 2-like isoform X2 n=1 Tax=Myxine glutinosa TaxID=7769 RepID=UPI00358EB81B
MASDYRLLLSFTGLPTEGKPQADNSDGHSHPSGQGPGQQHPSVITATSPEDLSVRHTSTGRYECTHCGLSTHDFALFTGHVDAAHPDVMLNPMYVCTACGVRTPQQAVFAEHNAQHHPSLHGMRLRVIKRHDRTLLEQSPVTPLSSSSSSTSSHSISSSTISWLSSQPKYKSARHDLLQLAANSSSNPLQYQNLQELHHQRSTSDRRLFHGLILKKESNISSAESLPGVTSQMPTSPHECPPVSSPDVEAATMAGMDGNGHLATAFARFPYPSPGDVAFLASVTPYSEERIRAWFGMQRLRAGISWSPDEIEAARRQLIASAIAALRDGLCSNAVTATGAVVGAGSGMVSVHPSVAPPPPPVITVLPSPLLLPPQTPQAPPASVTYQIINQIINNNTSREGCTDGNKVGVSGISGSGGGTGIGGISVSEVPLCSEPEAGWRGVTDNYGTKRPSSSCLGSLSPKRSHSEISGGITSPLCSRSTVTPRLMTVASHLAALHSPLPPISTNQSSPTASTQCQSPSLTASPLNLSRSPMVPPSQQHPPVSFPSLSHPSTSSTLLTSSSDTTTTKRHRKHKKSKEQLAALKASFVRSQHPDDGELRWLMERTGLGRSEIKKWFSDSRYHQRSVQTGGVAGRLAARPLPTMCPANLFGPTRLPYFPNLSIVDAINWTASAHRRRLEAMGLSGANSLPGIASTGHMAPSPPTDSGSSTAAVVSLLPSCRDEEQSCNRDTGTSEIIDHTQGSDMATETESAKQRNIFVGSVQTSPSLLMSTPQTQEANWSWEERESILHHSSGAEQGKETIGLQERKEDRVFLDNPGLSVSVAGTGGVIANSAVEPVTSTTRRSRLSRRGKLCTGTIGRGRGRGGRGGRGRRGSGSVGFAGARPRGGGAGRGRGKGTNVGARPKKTAEQLFILKSVFRRTQWPSAEEYAGLQGRTGLPRSAIVRWFGDTRFAFKHGQLRWMRDEQRCATVPGPSGRGGGVSVARRGRPKGYKRRGARARAWRAELHKKHMVGEDEYSSDTLATGSQMLELSGQVNEIIIGEIPFEGHFEDTDIVEWNTVRGGSEEQRTTEKQERVVVNEESEVAPGGTLVHSRHGEPNKLLELAEAAAIKEMLGCSAFPISASITHSTVSNMCHSPSSPT